ncbi:hypothetical protein E2C01_019908 [Portunus trituberculatus]|uniref:Uncharacterized protein n=1 Tax=Portunus trituberculatus TaxID=210409 RepID=A0A5B7DYP9_PORTR|nr:hypothetical protein [Portunus trituberculatus]
MTGSRRRDEATAASWDKSDCSKTKERESKIHSAFVASRDEKVVYSAVERYVSRCQRFLDIK